MTNAMNSLVSVVIPTYNHARFLGRALQSVLDQTYTNWEAIVIDNHSTDNTDEVMTSFVDPRIRYLKIHNKGVIAASRNMGIKTAKGEWVAFLDSDDWWTNDKLKVCFDCMNDKEDLFYHDLKIVTDQPKWYGRGIIKFRQVKKPVLIDLLVNGNAIANSSVVVRRALLNQIGGIDESADMVAAEDYNTWLCVAQLTDEFKYVPKQLGFYQLHDQGISSEKDMSLPVSYAVAEFIDFLCPKQKNKFKAWSSYTSGRFEYLAGNYMSAKKKLIICILYGSLNLKFKAVWMFIMAIIYMNMDIFIRINK